MHRTFHDVYVAVHAARQAAPEHWSDQDCTRVITAAMGGRAWSWPVVGITPEALMNFAKVDFYNRKEIGVVRAHLRPRIDTVRELVNRAAPATFDEFSAIWSERDRTVLACKTQNSRGLEDYIPFDAGGLFSSARLVGWKHGREEREFLRQLHHSSAGHWKTVKV